MPIGTIGLIVVNVLCFIITGGGDFQRHPGWLIEYGHLNPLEWISAAFFHLGIAHLVGNMFFLWAFGLIVEGKIGLQKFLGVYFGIAVAHGLIEQLIMLQQAGGSAGASGVIFGLLAIAMIWAPSNDLHCGGMFLLRPFSFQISIIYFSTCYLLLQFVFASIQQFAMSSSVIHLLGAALGLIVGIFMVKTNRVNCDNWDIFNVLNGTNTQTIYERDTGQRRKLPGRKKKRRTAEEVEAADVIKTKRSDLVAKFNRLLGDKKALSAFRTWKQIQRLFPEESLSQDQAGKLIACLYKASAWREVVPLLEDFVERYPDDANQSRIRLAFVLLDIQKRPRAALKTVSGIDRKKLTRKEFSLLKSLSKSARALIEEGVIELKDQPWQ